MILMTINEDVYLDVELLDKFMEDNNLLTSGYFESNQNNQKCYSMNFR